nr:transposase [Coxiella burnetii]
MRSPTKKKKTMQYRRVFIPNGTYFFTVNLLERRRSLLIDHIDQLRLSFSQVKLNHPFKIEAIVILPDHLHMIMTLPENDAKYSQRWNLIKGYFSRSIEKNERISMSRKSKRERGIWQRRFWEHLIRNEDVFEKHVNYIHYNPVKHGCVENPMDWQYSSIHYYVTKGILPAN